MEKICLNDSCKHIFDVELDIKYMLCPKCESATMPYEEYRQIKKINFSNDTLDPDNNYNRAIYLTAFHKYTKCYFAPKCMLLGIYNKDCEKEQITHKCFMQFEQELHSLHHKMDKILFLLDQINQNNQ